MASLAELLADLNSCDYLFLREIFEPAENQLRVIVEEASAGPPVDRSDVSGSIYAGCRIVGSNNSSRLFEITWPAYILYAVRNESYAAFDETAVRESGPVAVVCSKSQFLEHVKASTFACDDFPGPFWHVALFCQNHVVDVASTEHPTVKQLRPMQLVPDTIM